MNLVERFPTATGVPDKQAVWEVWFQRAGLLLLAAVVAAALSGWLGPRLTVAEASGPAGTLEVEHHSITRADLDTEIRVTVSPREDADSIDLSVDRAALQVWGVDSFVPEPKSQRVDGERVVLEFAAAGGGPVEIVFNGRTGTTEPPGSTPWTVRWETSDGPEVTAAVRVMP